MTWANSPKYFVRVCPYGDAPYWHSAHRSRTEAVKEMKRITRRGSAIRRNLRAPWRVEIVDNVEERVITA
jgi:hypothetical protein